MAKAKKKNKIISSITSFFSGVKSEMKKVVKPTKKNLIKFSVATLAFMIFICVFFVATDLLIALVSYVKELIG